MGDCNDCFSVTRCKHSDITQPGRAWTQAAHSLITHLLSERARWIGPTTGRWGKRLAGFKPILEITVHIERNRVASGRASRSHSYCLEYSRKVIHLPKTPHHYRSSPTTRGARWRHRPGESEGYWRLRRYGSNHSSKQLNSQSITYNNASESIRIYLWCPAAALGTLAAALINRRHVLQWCSMEARGRPGSQGAFVRL